ncbi:choline-binding transcriptional repressor BetI [Shimia ponticola]|uniref:choline-binding transcriptional repressor BetI n=1 Tax=Shimia ponticola TaxID=2582893 RepID=UPI0011BF8FA6|nr:transcriptional regulator BetI [Shimia ponticola]
MRVEATRRDQLVRAAIEEIGNAGSASVTVSQIAKRAGVSSALAFHYFGDKEQLFLGAMRHILREYQKEVRRLLSSAATPAERLHAVIRASFAPSNFENRVVSAWLVFYVTAQQSADAANLLRVYRRRLRSTLMHDLRQLNVSDPFVVAESIGAMIDGLYIRQALSAQDAVAATALVERYLDQAIAAPNQH